MAVWSLTAAESGVTDEMAHESVMAFTMTAGSVCDGGRVLDGGRVHDGGRVQDGGRVRDGWVTNSLNNNTICSLLQIQTTTEVGFVLSFLFIVQIQKQLEMPLTNWYCHIEIGIPI